MARAWELAEDIAKKPDEPGARDARGADRAPQAPHAGLARLRSLRRDARADGPARAPEYCELDGRRPDMLFMVQYRSDHPAPTCRRADKDELRAARERARHGADQRGQDAPHLADRRPGRELQPVGGRQPGGDARQRRLAADVPVHEGRRDAADQASRHRGRRKRATARCRRARSSQEARHERDPQEHHHLRRHQRPEDRASTSWSGCSRTTSSRRSRRSFAAPGCR